MVLLNRQKSDRVAGTYAPDAPADRSRDVVVTTHSVQAPAGPTQNGQFPGAG
jgi:hypothetical protein